MRHLDLGLVVSGHVGLLEDIVRITHAASARAKDVRAAAVRSGVDEAALTRGLNVRARGAMIVDYGRGVGVSRGARVRDINKLLGKEASISVVGRKRERVSGTKG